MDRIVISVAIALASLALTPERAEACGVKLSVKSARIRRPVSAASEREPIATGPQEERRRTPATTSAPSGQTPSSTGGGETGQARTARAQPRPPADEAAPPTPPADREPATEKQPTDIGDRRGDSSDKGGGDTAQPPPRDESTAHFGKRIFFANGSASLSAKSKARLRQNAKWLQQNPGKSVSVEGHANTVGNPDANQALSQRRAELVKDYLVELGVDESRISVQAFGSERPEFQPGSSGKNRRVVLSVD